MQNRSNIKRRKEEARERLVHKKVQWIRAAADKKKADEVAGSNQGNHDAFYGRDEQASFEDKSDDFKQAYKEGYAKKRNAMTDQEFNFNRGKYDGHMDFNEKIPKKTEFPENAFYKAGYETGYANNNENSVALSEVSEDYRTGRRLGIAAANQGRINIRIDWSKSPDYVRGFYKGFKEKRSKTTKAELDYKRGKCSGMRARRYGWQMRTDFQDESPEYQLAYLEEYKLLSAGERDEKTFDDDATAEYASDTRDHSDEEISVAIESSAATYPGVGMFAGNNTESTKDDPTVSGKSAAKDNPIVSGTSPAKRQRT